MKNNSIIFIPLRPDLIKKSEFNELSMKVYCGDESEHFKSQNKFSFETIRDQGYLSENIFPFIFYSNVEK